MAGFKVTVKENITAELAGKLAVWADRAEEKLADQVQKDTRQFVPASENKVLDKTTIVKGNMIIYPGPYAHYLYIGKLYVDPETGSSWVGKGKHKVITTRDLDIKKTTNPKAQARWFEASKKRNMEKWERVFKKAVLEK